MTSRRPTELGNVEFFDGFSETTIPLLDSDSNTDILARCGIGPRGYCLMILMNAQRRSKPHHKLCRFWLIVMMPEDPFDETDPRKGPLTLHIHNASLALSYERMRFMLTHSFLTCLAREIAFSRKDFQMSAYNRNDKRYEIA